MEKTKLQAALRIVLSYALLASLWIFFSDRILGMFLTTPGELVKMSTWKGLFFVLITSLLLFSLVRREFLIQQENQQAILERESRLLKSEEELRSSQERLERILETVPSGIIIVDRDRNIGFANLSAERILGLSWHDLKDRTYNDPRWKVIGSDGEPVGQGDFPIDQVWRLGKSVFGVEQNIERADGTRCTLRVNAAPQRDRSGNLTGVVASMDDVTEEKVREVALRESEKQSREQVIRLAALSEALEKTNNELTTAYDATLEGWAKALELRDRETEGHSRRVTDLTVRLADGMGIKGDDLTHIRRGAMLHDIGKLGVPDAILLKPGSLSEEERQVMQLHPVYAYEMLKDIPYLAPALDIPYWHHEHWDGSGYPTGLKGEKIPLAARIFTLVDVWDAVLSPRPYRPAWSVEQAWAYISQESGKYFDPAVVDFFTRWMQTSGNI